MRSWGVAAALTLLVFPAQHATVVDGDTLKWSGTTWRLHGIDAPEMKQWCGDYPAGVVATGVLQKLISEGERVTCEAKTVDRFGRTVGVCRIDGRDLGKAMVELGMALAFVRYSADYVAEEEQARAAGLGMHNRGCATPWDFRASHRK